MRPAYSHRPSFTPKPRKIYQKSYSKPIVNYQVKGFNNDSDNPKSMSPQGFHQSSSFSGLASSSEEERSEHRELFKAKVMCEGTLIQTFEEGEHEKQQEKFQDACEKIGPNPKQISLPWFA